MNDQTQAKILAFDTLFTTNHIQILKILLSYMKPSSQKLWAVYIKFLELQYTYAYFNRQSPGEAPYIPHEETFIFTKLNEEISPYCNQDEKEQLTKINEIFQNLENFQEMTEMIKMMEMMQNTFSTEENSGSNMHDDTNTDLFQLFQMLQSNPTM